MKKYPPFFSIVLMIVLFFQSVSALFGGYMLVSDPSGGKLQMPLKWLVNSPFYDFLVPGIILFIVLGLFPLFTLGCLIFRPSWKWPNMINVYRSRYFAWTFSLYTGIMLNIWITVQIFLVGYGTIIQTIYSALGISITILTLIPEVMDYYIRREDPKKGVWRTL